MIDTQGKLLVAPPGMPDWRFQKTVVYIWRHDVSGACGVIINKKCNHPTFSHVCEEGQVKRKLEILSYPVCYVYASVLLKERKQDHRCYLIGSFVFDL